jgi:hypothetical protein
MDHAHERDEDFLRDAATCAPRRPISIGAKKILIVPPNQPIHEIETGDLRQTPGRETAPGFYLVLGGGRS